MKTVFGSILLIIGLFGTLITGVNAIQQTETFNFLGKEIVISSGNYFPVIVSIIILFMGVALLSSARGR